MEPKYQRTSGRPFRARGRGGYQRNAQRDQFEDGYQDINQELPMIPDTATTAAFRGMAAELDVKNDLYEVLVKHSRDTTIESKRIIFLLLRCGGLSRESLEVHQILREAQDRLQQLRDSAMRMIAKKLNAEDPNLFRTAYSPGLQEFIEALTLYHYLDSGTLIELEDAQKDLKFTDEDSPDAYTFPLSPINFLLGIGDLTGELMRYSVTQAGSATARHTVFRLCDFSRAVLMEFQRVPFLGGLAGKDFGGKLRVMQQSVFKIERICYQLALRQAENLPALPVSMMKLESDMPDEGDRF